jgi:hypothetical protein
VLHPELIINRNLGMDIPAGKDRLKVAIVIFLPSFLRIFLAFQPFFV